MDMPNNQEVVQTLVSQLINPGSYSQEVPGACVEVRNTAGFSGLRLRQLIQDIE